MHASRYPSIPQQRKVGDVVSTKNMKYAKLVYLPDWSKDNPYQKLLYSEISKAGLPCDGLQGRDFSFHWLWNNKKEVSHLHLHWLFGVYDPDSTGLNSKKAILFLLKIILARFLGYQVLWTVHNFISHEPSHLQLERVVRRAVARLASHPIVHCNYAKDLVRNNWKIADHKISVIPHGSYVGFYPDEVTRSEAREKLGIQGNSFTFLFFGMLRNYKGIRPLITAFLDVQKSYPAARLIIAGKPFSAEIKSDIEGMAQHDNISLFLQYIPDDEVQNFFNASDAVVLPYQNILTSGAAVLAITFAKPVIVPRKGCIPELISDDIGFLYEHERELTRTMLDAVERRIDTEQIRALAVRTRWDNIVNHYYTPLIFGTTLSRSLHEPAKQTSTEKKNAMTIRHTSIKISAIICTHNRSDLLPSAVKSLQEQSLPASLFEIIVVDNASTDDTKSVCEQFTSSANFRYTYEPVPGLSVARNRGASESMGKYVAFMDDDAIASPDWLRLLVNAFEQVSPAPASVGGKIEPIWEIPKPQWLPQQHIACLTILDYGDTAKFIRYPTILYGTNMAFDREQLLLHSGFRVDIGRKKNCLLSCEESDIYRKFASAGLHTYYEPDAYVHHLVPKERLEKKWIYKRQYWQGRSEVLMLPQVMTKPELLDEIRFCVTEMKNNLATAFKTLLVPESDSFSSISHAYYFFGRIRQLFPKYSSAKAIPNHRHAVDHFHFNDIVRWEHCGEIMVETAESDLAGKEPAIKISGNGGKDSWNFIQTEKVHLKRNTRYQFSGWMRIDSLTEGTSFFKCEIFQKSKWLQNVDCALYDITKLGEWQHLAGEFLSPEEHNAELNIAVEKRPFEKQMEVSMFVSSLCIKAI
jgi:glycosyltransferase involved in cell wall biosynthesis/GT2 family glycosyltransferase